MSTKRPTTEEIVELLQQPGFRRPPDEEPPPTDPIRPTPMRLAVDEIRPYDKNPRRVANAEYEAIKESIRAAGMDQTLTVTRRPGDKLYMIGAGGNTRLLAIQELWRETGDERFKEIHVLFIPWRGDAETLVAHLRENDLRGDLTLIDRAFAIRELRAMLEEERGESLSLRALSEALKARGYRVGKSMIALYDYVVDFLHPAIPEALAAGLGKPQVERIQALERAFVHVWEALGVPDPEAGRAIFREVLARLDGERIDLDRFRIDLHAELSVSADCAVNQAALFLGAALDGRDVESLLARHPVEDEDDDAGEAEQDAPAGTPDTRSRVAGMTEPGPAGHGGEPSAGEGGAFVRESVSPARHPETRSAGPAGAPPAPSSDEEQASGRHGKDHLRNLRIRAGALACRITQAVGFYEGVVTEIPNNGAGFIVNRPILSGNEEQQRRQAIVWWMLAAISEQFHTANRASEYMSRGMVVGHMVGILSQVAAYSRWESNAPNIARWLSREARNISSGMERVYQEVPACNGPDLGPFFLDADTGLDDETFEAWLELARIYREIRRLCDDCIWERQWLAEGQEGALAWKRRLDSETGFPIPGGKDG